HKPLSHAMFSNYRMVETIGTMLDPDLEAQRKWDATQWEAYCRIVLMVFRNYVEKGFWEHSYVLYRPTSHIEHAASDLYRIDGIGKIAWDDDVQARLRVVVEFIKDAVEVLDQTKVPEHLKVRRRDKHGPAETPYDRLAELIFEIIFSASSVTAPGDLCW